MDIDKLIEVGLSLLPAILVAAIAYYFFKQHIENENNIRRFKLQKSMQKETFPIRLQAYERMVLFLERISPSKLLTRIHPNSSNKVPGITIPLTCSSVFLASSSTGGREEKTALPDFFTLPYIFPERSFER